MTKNKVISEIFILLVPQIFFSTGKYVFTKKHVFLYYSDDLPKLKYLTMCLKESLRLHTTAPLIQRETTKDMTIDGRHVPAGTLVSIFLYMLHHHEEVWPDSQEYRPERFFPENTEKMDAFAFCPFSA